MAGASQVVPADSEPSGELWVLLAKAQSAPAERAAAYQSLAGFLKGDVSPEFISTLTSQHKNIIKLVMDDIAARACAQEAIQLLGYCLFTPQFAEVCGEEAGNIIGALCSVQYEKPTEKSILTRALWCLSSQNFHSYQICHSVPQVVTLATEIILEHGFGSLAVESLNVFRRIHQQCPKEFGLVVSMWYKGILVLLQCKVAKFQRKAHSFAVLFEPSISSNTYLVNYLCKELKEKVIGALLGYMEERGKDPILIMSIWSHFVTVLGHALHKHSSFLNEMLRVVEMGFKHKVFLVQVAAYGSWKILISNFSKDMDRLTQQRRLKLLLMPLLASAVKDKHEQVETARLLTWWHLIRTLGPSRELLFHQVCVPFLLFCLGVDPKLDLSKLPSLLADLVLATPPPNGAPPSMPETHPAQQDKENQPTTTPRCPTGQGKTPSGQGVLLPGATRAGRLLTMLSSSSPGRKSDRYQNTPKLGLVVSGCQAVLQFVGCEEKLQRSLLDTDGVNCVVFQRSAVPFNVIQFLAAFLDGALLYVVHYAKEVKESSVEILFKSLFPIFLSSIKRESVSDAKAAAHLVTLLIGMLRWEAIVTNVSSTTRLDLLSQLIIVPPSLTSIITATHGPLFWCGVAHELVSMAPTEYCHLMFLTCWGKLVEMSTVGSGGPVLATFTELCCLLDRFAMGAVPSCPRRQQPHPAATLHRMWTSLGHRFTTVVGETNQVNEGTALDPNFSAARRILKFPFLHRVFYTTEKPTMSVTFETWKEVYDTFNIHSSLIMKDPNHCADLVGKDIYDSYGQNVRGDSTTLDRPETVIFDSYQNTVGLALNHVLTKFNWSSLRSCLPGERVGGRNGGERGGKGAREGALKTVQPLVSVLSWQLATLWDTVQRSPMHIGQLTSPYTLMETVTLLYSHLPSPDPILATSEMLAQPLVTLWQNVLESEAKPPTGNHRSLHKGPFDLPERIVKTWRSILACVQSRYSTPFTSDLLAALSPLLVLSLSCGKQEVVSHTLSFWSATFDSSPDPLVYPNKLRDVFSRNSKKWDISLRLPGFEVSGTMAHSTHEDGLSLSNSATPHLQTPPTDEAVSRNSGVVIPHSSPQRGVGGSFLGPNRSPRPGGVLTTPPRSPAAQDMEEILARSRGQGGRGEGSAGVASLTLSARRKLSLNSDKSEDYVMVEPPPAKRQQLLTDHQRERLGERREGIPAMYNALDPSQDLSQSAAQSSLPDSALEEPIIIPESEGSPPTTITTRSIVPSTSTSALPPPPPYPGHASSFRPSIIQGPSSSGNPPASSLTTAVVPLSGTPMYSNAPASTNPASLAGHSDAGVELSQLLVGVASTHVRKSPISSRTRSRARPDEFDVSPSGNGAPYPMSHEVSPYLSGSHLFGAHARAATGMTPARLNFHNISPTLPLPHYLPLCSPPSSGAPAFSPTDQHYQSLHGQHMLTPASVPRCDQQQVYRMIESATCYPLTVSVPLNQQVITANREPRPTNTSLAQFGPIVPHSAPVAPNSIQSGASSPQFSDPTFPPARYIIRTQGNPPPYSLHSPPVQHESPPLPLSAVVRPDLSRLNKQQSSSLATSQHSLPPVSGSLTAVQVSGYQELLRGSVDSPIIIEDVEEPLTTPTADLDGKRDEEPVVEAAGETSVCESQIVISSETDEEGQLATEGVGEGPSVPTSGDTQSEAEETVATESRRKTLESIKQLQEEDMEVVCSESERETTGEEQGSISDGGALMVAMSPQKLPSDTPFSISSENLDSGPLTNAARESKSPNVEERAQTVAAVESEPLSDSCEPGPAMLDPLHSSWEEVPASLETNEPASSSTGDSGASESAENEGESESMDLKSDSDVSPTNTSSGDQTNIQLGSEEQEGKASDDTVRSAEVTDVESGEERCTSDSDTKKDEVAIEGGLSSADVEEEEESSRDEASGKRDAGKNHTQSEEEAKEKTVAECGSGEGKTALEESPVRTLTEILPVPVTPTNTDASDTHASSPKTTPGGILKHTSQFDTPTSTAGRGRRVQFASSPVVFQPSKAEEEAFRTPRHSRSRTGLSSRRTLLKTDSTAKASQNQKATSTEPVYPSLADCNSPVEDILPVLSPSRRFTHGLVHLVHARNIRTVGNISSLTKQQVQTLPIKSPKIENLKQALRNFQQHLGTKRRASVESDSLGPPAKKRSREGGPEERGEGKTTSDQQPPTETNREPEREDSDSQLSLASSEPSQSEPAVVLSSPTDNPSEVATNSAENDKGEPLQSGDVMDDVFVEETQTTDGGGGCDHVTDISTIEYRNEVEEEEDDDTIETGSALEKSCPSPPMAVGSPEIPLQSSPSESPLGGTFDRFASERSGQSVCDSHSSDSEEGEEEMELGDREESVTDESSQKQTSLQHDHAYFSSGSEGEGVSRVAEGPAVSESEGAVPAAELADHDYCSGPPGTGSSLEQQDGSQLQPQLGGSPPSDQRLTEFRSKLSSDIQDHNYCRQLVPNPQGASPEGGQELVEVGDIVTSNEACNLAESQELFSQNDDRIINQALLADKDAVSLPVLSDVACQTETPITQEQLTSTFALMNSSIPSDGDMESSLRTYVDGVLGREDLPVATLWKLHQQLMCSLFKVSEKLRAENS